MHHGPAVRRRKLGEELRRLRALRGLTSGEAAARVGWHQSKVSRIETGRSGVKASDVTRLLDAYEVSDPQQHALLRALASGGGESRGPRWWHAYKELLPPEYRDFISLESQASHVRSLEMSVVPGLLQTRAYARAVTRAALTGASAERIEALVEVRLARQDILRSGSVLSLSVLLDEAVLRRPVGGPEVMAEQLLRLREAADLPQVRLQVVPFGAGEHRGLTGPFVIFSFPAISDLDVIVLDHLTSSLYLERKEDLGVYSAAFDAVREQALTPEESVAFIAGIGDGA